MLNEVPIFLHFQCGSEPGNKFPLGKGHALRTTLTIFLNASRLITRNKEGANIPGMLTMTRILGCAQIIQRYFQPDSF